MHFERQNFRINLLQT